MERCLVLIALLGLLAPAPIARAQQDSGTAGSKQSDPQPQMENGTILYLELSKTVDVKKAKIGDEISALLLNDVVSHGKVVVRRYSTAIGHVTEAQALTKENQESRLGIVFDKIRLKHSPEVAISTILMAVRPSQQLQTEPPPIMGTRGPNSTGTRQTDLSFPAPRGLSPLHSKLGQDIDSPLDTRASMHLMEIEGLSLQPSHNGSDKVVVSSTRNVKLESRMRLEVRVDNKTK